MRDKCNDAIANYQAGAIKRAAESIVTLSQHRDRGVKMILASDRQELETFGAWYGFTPDNPLIVPEVIYEWLRKKFGAVPDWIVQGEFIKCNGPTMEC